MWLTNLLQFQLIVFIIAVHSVQSSSVKTAKTNRKTSHRNQTSSTVTTIIANSETNNSETASSISQNLFSHHVTKNSNKNNNNHKKHTLNNNNSNNNNNKKHRISNRNTKRIMKHTTAKTTAEFDSSLTDESIKQIEIVNVTAKVGETVVLSCAINSSHGTNPGVIWMQGKLGNVLTLNTNRITLDPRFDIIQHAIVQQPKKQPTAEDLLASSLSSPASGIYSDYLVNSLQNFEPSGKVVVATKQQQQQQQQNEISYFNLRIENVQIYDENEYACETSITKGNDDTPNLNSLISLYITQSPSFIESQTSESNLIALEYADVTLKCFAVGKPTPKIKWYLLNEETNFIKDLNQESNSLVIRNISKNDNHKYECVASNGILPSVSKKLALTVYFTPTVQPMKPKVYQSKSQTALIGCIVVSNPESSISWFRRNPSFIQVSFVSNSSSLTSLVNNTEPEYLLVDAASPRYQIHKYKQANQTVSYFKIKNLEEADYTKYKCEATNIVGKSESVVELIESSEISAKHGGKKSNKEQQQQESNFLSRSRVETDYDDQLEDSNENYQYLNGDSNNEVDSKQKSSVKKANSPKKATTSRNKTLSSKYQLIKPNPENRLQRIRDFISSRSSSQPYLSAFLFYALLSILLCMNLYLYL